MIDTQELIAALQAMGLARPGESPPLVPLAGGVSSDIYRVDLEGGPVCVKRALAKLKVAADWRAPVERNRYEAQWIRVVSRIAPEAVPELLGEAPSAGCFAMRWLPPERYPVWKAQLRDGIIEPAVASEVGRRIARIHDSTAGRPEVAGQFATDAIFRAIRLEPYLLATARAHPDCAERLQTLAADTASFRRALVHGDVSPKNVLVGPGGPVFLDAECAWYGDPCFDLAFCANHLLLKCVWRPPWRERYLACYAALVGAYLEAARWERTSLIEARTAALLPGLLLARVDGNSPVEYLTEERDRERVRHIARAFVLQPPQRMDAIAAAWREEVAA